MMLRGVGPMFGDRIYFVPVAVSRPNDMSKQELDSVRLEERAKMLAKASEEVSKMLKEMATSEQPSAKGEKSKQKKNKGNQQNKGPAPNKRGCQSLSNLNVGNQGKKGNEGGGQNRGAQNRGAQNRGTQNRGGRGYGRGYQNNQNQLPLPGQQQEFPPSYEESTQNNHQCNPQHQQNMRRGMTNANRQFQYPANQFAGNPILTSNQNMQPHAASQFQQQFQKPKYPNQQNFAHNYPSFPQATPPLLQNLPFLANTPKMQNPPPLMRHPQPDKSNPPKPLPRKMTQGGKVVDLYLIVEKLASFTGFFTNAEALSKLVGANYEEVMKIIKSSSAIFSTIKDNSRKDSMVELCPCIKLCKGHSALSGCKKNKCLDMHICPDFVNENCTDKKCQFGHSWKTNHNDFILRNFRLDRLSNNTLLKLMQKVFSGQIAPKVCLQYQEQTCNRGKNCLDLHICNSFLTTLGNCTNGDQCSYNHNVKEQSCKAIIEKYGISTNESPRDLLKILAARCKDNNKPSITKNNAVTQDAKDKKKVDSTDSAKRDSSKSQNTVHAFQFKGNVEIPMICTLGLDGKCLDFQKGCKYLHSKNTFAWQFGTVKNWYNFHAFHSAILERHFRDVTCDDAVLPELDPEKVNPGLKDLFSLLGKKGIKVDFRNMIIDCESNKHVYSIRHVTTVSSAASDSKHSTAFTWYFKDDDNSWKVFGRSEASSRVIEKSYQDDPTKPVIFTSATTKFKYQIDYSNLTQTNMETQKTRQLKRRPKPFSVKDDNVVEKLDIPRHWDKMDDDEEFKLVALAPECDEYKEIRQIIQLTMPMSQIGIISRIQNVHIWKQFSNKQSELQKKYKDNYLNTQKLCIGVSSKIVNEICRENFDWRIQDPDGDKRYGLGAYFYNSAGVASKGCIADFMGYKTLLVAEVIIGCVAQGTRDLRRPPENPAFNKLFDTTVDDVSCPTTFVKYNKQEYYPSFIVEFK